MMVKNNRSLKENHRTSEKSDETGSADKFRVRYSTRYSYKDESRFYVRRYKHGKGSKKCYNHKPIHRAMCNEFSHLAMRM